VTLFPILADPPAGPPAAPPPGSRQWHRFEAGGQRYVLVVDGTRLFRIDGESWRDLAAAEDSGAGGALEKLGIAPLGTISDSPLTSHPIRSLSLAVSQKCNLACTYCYAEGGSFGETGRNMPVEVAAAAVDRLFADVAPGEKVNLSFLGGEPLVNRTVLRAAAEAAVEKSRRAGTRLGLAVTTNATLLTPEDGDFFERHGFAVTVSLDGVGEAHDRQRPFKDGRGSFGVILERVRPLLEAQRKMQVSARVTVTPRNLHLAETLDELIGLGFHSVGFSPMLSSPTGLDEMHEAGLEAMLEQMVECGGRMERAVRERRRYPFSNLVTALEQLHRGTHRPYPCGAGAGYFGVSADGELSACHRFVNDPAGAMGDLEGGVDAERQSRWLSQRHVHFQQPCRDCWARYLCGGGCHHEVIHRGRPACDFIRGWLEYCLGAYARLLAGARWYFQTPA
jgi:uncharacterized protein